MDIIIIIRESNNKTRKLKLLKERKKESLPSINAIYITKKMFQFPEGCNPAM